MTTEIETVKCEKCGFDWFIPVRLVQLNRQKASDTEFYLSLSDAREDLFFCPNCYSVNDGIPGDEGIL